MPTRRPTSKPTQSPTQSPTNPPTQYPTNTPTQYPTNTPTQEPTTSSPTTSTPTQSPVLSCVPEAMILLDRSCSMHNPSTYGQLYWDIAITNLRQLFNRPDIDQVRWGLFLYPDTNHDNGDCIQDVRFDFGPNSTTQTKDWISNYPPDDYPSYPCTSPASFAIEEILELESLQSPNSKISVIWITSDGAANVACNNKTHTDPHVQLSELYTRPNSVRTFMVGMDIQGNRLSSLAVAGGTARVGADIQYYSIGGNNTNGLMDIFSLLCG
jgi:hypothetical protein